MHSSLPSDGAENDSRESEPIAKTANSTRLVCRGDAGFVEWLAASGGSLAVTTYNAGKLVLASAIDGRVKWRVRKFARPMGMALCGDRLVVAARERLFEFRSQQVSLPQTDAAFAPVRQWETGRCDAHDVAIAGAEYFFVNTRHNCIAQPSATDRFSAVWKPAFISEIAEGDRCHLNGVGLRDGRPAAVTTFATTNEKKGWRGDGRLSSGLLLETETGDVLADGLCMPHSPRWHRDRWYFCNSGLGTLNVVAAPGEHREIASLPGFTRGLSFVGDYALVGLSRVRPEHVLDAPLLRARQGRSLAGVALVDLRVGQQVGLLEFTRGGSEVYEALFLPGIQRPNLRVPQADTAAS